MLNKILHKKIPSVISYSILAAIILGLGLILVNFISLPESQEVGVFSPPSPGVLKITQVDTNKYTFKTSEGDVVEMGVKEHSPAQPYAKLNKWDGECSVSVSLPTDVQTDLQLEDGKVKWKEDERELHMYPIEETEDYSEGFEYEVILKEKPETNIITLGIETEGLKFYYQPPLNQEKHDGGVVRCTATECKDKDGNVVVKRPENTVGSYAVYHESKRGDYHLMGGKNYRAGKAFHIYRPKIIDGAGKEVWGNLNIDEKKGILSVEIPQDFIDNAVYPVRHAAGLTFGKTAEGLSTFWRNANWLVGLKATSGSDAGGTTVSKFSVYAFEDYAGTLNVKPILINSTGYILTNGVGTGAVIPASVAWTDLSFGTQPSISASTLYYLGVICDVGSSNLALKYDAGANEHCQDSNNYASPTDPYDSWITNSSYEISVYATYGAGNSAPSAPSSPIPTDGATGVE